MISPEKVQTESLLFYVEFDLSYNEKRKEKKIYHKIFLLLHFYLLISLTIWNKEIFEM
jgi:hypothetical protein